MSENVSDAPRGAQRGRVPLIVTEISESLAKIEGLCTNRVPDIRHDLSVV
jgi:hypothetical protein